VGRFLRRDLGRGGHARTATITAKSPLRLFVLIGQAFRSVLDRNPAVERKVMIVLARRLAEFAGDPGLI